MKNSITFFAFLLCLVCSNALLSQHNSNKAFLGVSPNHGKMPDGLEGMKVNIIKNSTAEGMGMESGDIITVINGEDIEDWHDLTDEVRALKPNDEIGLTFVRNGTYWNVNSKIKSYNETYNPKKEVKEKEEEKVFQVFNITEEEAEDMEEKYNVEMPIVNDLKIQQLNIFPNPNNGLFNLTFNLPQKEKTIIRVYSSNAQIVYEKELTNFQGFFEEQINITNRPSGNYFLMIQQADQSISKRVVVQNY